MSKTVLIVIICIILVSTLFIGGLEYFGRGIQDIVYPFQMGMYKTSSGVSSFIINLLQLNDLKEENELLSNRVAELAQQVNRLRTMGLENERLRELLDLKIRTEEETIAAEVIGPSPSNWTYYLTINRGSRDGIKRDMPVVSPNGMVGKISEVTTFTSRVELTIDPIFSVGGLVERSREVVMVRGHDRENFEIVFESLVRDADIIEGDIIVSSGLGSIFPKGIPIGEIVRLEENKFSLFKQGVIKPYVDFTRIEEVLVILDTEPQGDEQL